MTAQDKTGIITIPLHYFVIVGHTKNCCDGALHLMEVFHPKNVEILNEKCGTDHRKSIKWQIFTPVDFGIAVKVSFSLFIMYPYIITQAWLSEDILKSFSFIRCNNICISGTSFEIWPFLINFKNSKNVSCFGI